MGAAAIAVVLIGAYGVRHAGTADWNDFFNCNEQSVNFVNTHAEYDDNQRAAHGAIENDRCMAKKGFEYSGGSNTECMSARTAECYSRPLTEM